MKTVYGGRYYVFIRYTVDIFCIEYFFLVSDEHNLPMSFTLLKVQIKHIHYHAVPFRPSFSGLAFSAHPAYAQSTSGQAAGHRSIFARREVLSFCSSVRLYAWPVAECWAVISPSHQRCGCCCCRRCRDPQVPSCGTKWWAKTGFRCCRRVLNGYYTLASSTACTGTDFMYVIPELIAHW